MYQRSAVFLFIAISATGTTLLAASGRYTTIRATSAATLPPVGNPLPANAGVLPPLLPTPPRQNTPWTLPEEKDTSGLPTSLLSATQALFGQGLADPRGGEYRVITVQVGTVWRGDGGVVQTHGWVFPPGATGEKSKRFAACWNGLVYSVVEVKGKADLQADMEQLIAKQKELLDTNPNISGFTLLWSRAIPEAISVSVESPSLLKVAYLLRLGENELARRAYALLETGTPPRQNGNDEIRRDPYLLLATQWAWSAYDRAVCAHMRGADRLALADTDLLNSASLIENDAAQRGYKTYPNGGIHEPGKPFLQFLENLPALRRDSLRRVTEASRRPLREQDLKNLKARPQKERIASLIDHLDEIDVRQDGQPGGVGMDAHLVSEALIAEGDAAIEPLLNVLEKDDRLTRSVSFPREFFLSRNLLPVKSAAFACFSRITDVTEIGEGREKLSVAALRKWWDKNKDASPTDRWFRQLAEDSPITSPPRTSANQTGQPAYEQEPQRQREEFARVRAARNRWEEAAKHIVEHSDVLRRGNWVSVSRTVPGQPPPPFKGEPLRSRRDPSVSALLRKRALQLSEPTPGRWGFDFAGGANFALMLYEWEPQGSETLPTLREVMERCLTFQYQESRESGHSDQYQLGGRIARLTIARLRLGDKAAATEYQKWLQSVSAGYLGFEARSALLPLLKEQNNPAIQRMADALFTEAVPAPSVWSRLLIDPKERGNYTSERLFASELIRFPVFRQLVVRRLRNRTEAGLVVEQNSGDQNRHRFTWLDGSAQGATAPRNSTQRRETLRFCDRAALALQRVAGVPRFDPVAPLAQRDKQCAAIATYLTRYGSSLGRMAWQDSSLGSPLYSYDSGSDFDYLGPLFTQNNRPATEDDVRENRAIFTLHDSKARVVSASDLPAPLPIEAQWSGDPNPDPNTTTQIGGENVPLSRGYIWQAEERFEKGKWTRYYGYVGPHSLVKVPASELQIVDYRVARPKRD
jgi:hypothetical protein